MPKKAIPLLIFLLAFSIQLTTFSPWDTLTYDGALYIDIARNLVRSPSNFTYQGVYVMYRPPLYPYTLSIAYHFVKEPLRQLSIARIVSVVFFSLTALLVYLLSRELFEDRTKSIIASLFFMFNPLALTMGGRELVHSQFTFFYTLAIYLFYTGRKYGNREKVLLAFIAGGFAILTRYTGLSIVGVFFTYLWLVEYWGWVREKTYWIGILLLLLTLFPWLYMGHLYYGGALKPFSIGMRAVTVDKPVAVSEYLKMILRDMGKIVPALALLGLLMQKQDERGWLLISWAIVGLCGILMVTHKETRFITFLSPALAILSADGLEAILNIIKETIKSLTEKKKLEAVLLTALVVILLTPTAMSAYHLKNKWNTVGKYESHTLRFASEHYPAEKILTSPSLYTMTGFYYPGARVEMPITKVCAEKLKNGYYQLIIYKESDGLLPPPPEENYVLAVELYHGKFKIYVKKSHSNAPASQ